MNSNTVIKVENISKKFCKSLSHIMKYGTVDIAKEFLGRKIDSSHLREGEFWAVNDISFELKRGEVLGIIGPNGSGKSTLLKMLNGIFMPDNGKVSISGKVGALIEVGAGFHPMLTGRENIYINGSILGFSKKEIDNLYDEIVEFAGIGDFIDVPVKHYSSGMYVRLGFAIAIHIKPELLLVDEVFAVGDTAFKQRATQKIENLFHSGVTIIMVSHNVRLLERLCNRVILMKKGEMLMDGSSIAVVREYHNQMIDLSSMSKLTQKQEIEVENNKQSLVLTGIRLLNKFKQEIDIVEVYEDVKIEIRFKTTRDFKDLVFTIGIQTIDLMDATILVSEAFYVKRSFFGEQTVVCCIPRLSLTPGPYAIRAGIGGYSICIAFSKSPLRKAFKVIANKESDILSRTGGVFMLEHKWE